MIPQDEYECPRCGYSSKHKSSIRNHLYKKQKQCPGSRNLIELTEDIKQHILDNKKYIIPTQSSTNRTFTQVINNYNTVNNFVSTIDFMDKLTKYMSYKNVELIDYSDKVKEQYCRTVYKLERNMIKDFKLKMSEFLEILDNVTLLCNGEYEHYNIHYNEKTRKMNLYEDGEWTTLLQEAGITKVITGIQEYFLDVYEAYLVRKLYSSNVTIIEKSDIKEYLIQYYIFLTCFDLYPYIKDKSDEYILNGREGEITCDNDSISEYLMNVYKTQKDKLTVGHREKIRKSVCEIIKRNSKQNLDELNKKVASLFNMDETFKQQLLNIGI